MKLISWNVNGLRACVQKGFLDIFKELNADMFCIQESKLQEGQISLELEGYHQYWNYAIKKGYSGTAIFTRREPMSVAYGIGIEEHDQEGRVITLEFAEFYLVTVYTPNSQSELARLDYRMRWEDAFLSYLKGLEEKKPIVFCGDLNVAHKEIDLKNPKTNRIDAVMFDSFELFIAHFAFDHIRGGRTDHWFFLFIQEFHTLYCGICSLVKLSWQEFHTEYLSICWDLYIFSVQNINRRFGKYGSACFFENLI